MLNLHNRAELDWPARNQDLENWLERGSQYIEGYRAGTDEEWDKICDRAEHGWNKLKTEARSLLDDTQA